MVIEDDYREFVASRTASGSGAAGSYVKAMNITDEVLKSNGLFLRSQESVWDIRDEARLKKLFDLVIKAQNVPDGGIYKNVKSKSYWKNKFCSAAIAKFMDFVATLS